MTTTFIKTGECARVAIPGAGEAAEVLNEALCGAKNVRGKLHWLSAGDRLAAQAPAAGHELVYLMEGDGVISLNGKDYDVKRGAGVYLGPNEAASIRPVDGALKLFHLSVPEVRD